MAEIYDRMNEQTQEKIQAVFLQLLKEKNFTRISVQDIAKAADINRGTFYLHYLDKYELLDRMESLLLDELEEHLRQLNPGMLLSEAEKSGVSFQAVEVFRYIPIHHEWFDVFLGDNNRRGFHRRLKDFFVRHFYEKMMGNATFFESSSVPPDYLSSFATSAFLGLIEQWLAKKLTESPEEMAEMYLQIISFIRNMKAE